MAGIVAVSLLVVVGCTSVKEGSPTADSKDAPAYRSSVATSLSISAASSSERETSRQESLTTQAMSTACNVLNQTAAAAVKAVNDYVGALNAKSPDTGSKEGPAIDALHNSADQVSNAINNSLPSPLSSALQAYADASRAVADAISRHASPDDFNKAVDKFNTTKTNAINQCP